MQIKPKILHKVGVVSEVSERARRRAEDDTRPWVDGETKRFNNSDVIEHIVVSYYVTTYYSLFISH